MTKDTVCVEPIICTRCNQKQYPKLDKQTGEIIYSKSCTYCRSPYYRTSITRKSVSESSKNYQKNSNR